MRLQYARLKVEHGWVCPTTTVATNTLMHAMQQKQNLNEVENLYFHHSQKGPRSFVPSKHSWITTTTVPSIPVLQLSSRFEEIPDRPREKQREEQIPGLHAFHVIPPPLDPGGAAVKLQGNIVEGSARQPSDPPANNPRSLSPSDPESMIVWDPDLDENTLNLGAPFIPSSGMGNLPTELSSSLVGYAGPSSSVGNGNHSQTLNVPPSQAPSIPVTTKPARNQPTPPLVLSPHPIPDTARSEIPEGSAASASRPSSQLVREPTAPSSTQGSSTQSPFGFSNASLTYDSFWSSHSSASTSYRNTRPNMVHPSASANIPLGGA